MGWRTQAVADGNYLHLIAEGPISTGEVLEQVHHGVALILEQQLPGAMIDYSAAILEMPLVDIYKVPDWFESATRHAHRGGAAGRPGEHAQVHLLRRRRHQPRIPGASVLGRHPRP